MRWVVIAGFGGYGIYTLIDGILHVSAKPDVHWAAFWFFLLPFLLVYSGLFMAVAYLTFAQQYRRLCALIAFVAAITAFSCIIWIPEWLGLADWADPRAHGADSFIEGLASIAALVAGWYGARWVYRRAHTFLLRYV